MAKIYMMIGVPGSGKSSYAKNVLKYTLNLSDDSIVSSDDIRKKYFGDENDQSHNAEVFKILYQKVRMLYDEGKDAIIDATSMSYKDRCRARNNLGKNYPISVAYVMATPILVCAARDASRERTVGLPVIRSMVYKFEFPYPGEFEEVNVIHSFDAGYYPADPEFTKKHMDKFDQKNFHHIYTVGEHCDKVANQFDERDIRHIAGKWHDVGKCFTQTFDDAGVAHYYQHANYGAYFLMSEDIFKSLTQDKKEEILFYVNQHMHIRDILKSPGAVEKYKKLWGEDRFNKLVEFMNADNNGSGTEYRKVTSS